MPKRWKVITMEQPKQPITEERPLPDAGAVPAFSPSTEDLDRLLLMRLSVDGMLLELSVLAGATRFPMQARVEAARRLIADLGVKSPPEENVLRRLLGMARENRWLVVATGTPVVPPVDGSVSVRVPSVPPLGNDRFHERACVQAGEIIARITPGRDGTPGVDLRGRAIPSTLAHQARVPAGDHTLLTEDKEGPTLVAACEGMISFDHMQFSVRPMRVVSGRALRSGATFATDEAVFIPDDVPSSASVTAGGDLYVAGDAEKSILVSLGGTVTVLGCVAGHYQQHCMVRAKGDVMVSSALHADIASGQDVYIQTQARNASISAVRHLVLLARLRSALYDVSLTVGGAVIPLDPPGSPSDVTHDERLVFNEACEIAAELGLREGSSVIFQPCAIHQISVAAAVLTMEGAPPPRSDTIVHLKFVLPDSRPIQILARTLTPGNDKQTPVEFRQISHQDELAVTAYCLGLARTRIALAGVDEPLPPVGSAGAGN
jgi:hypothetical protein